MPGIGRRPTHPRSHAPCLHSMPRHDSFRSRSLALVVQRGPRAGPVVYSNSLLCASRRRVRQAAASVLERSRVSNVGVASPLCLSLPCGLFPLSSCLSSPCGLERRPPRPLPNVGVASPSRLSSPCGLERALALQQLLVVSVRGAQSVPGCVELTTQGILHGRSLRCSSPGWLFYLTVALQPSQAMPDCFNGMRVSRPRHMAKSPRDGRCGVAPVLVETSD